MLKAYVYDISDRSEPKLLKDFSITGGYFQSRMIGDIVYIVTQDSVNYGGVYINEPMVKEASGSIVRPSIYYFDNPDENYQFNTITSLSLSSDDVVESKSFMLGYSNTLMVSEKNIYIAYQKQQYWWGPWYYQRDNYDKDRFYDVILPALDGQLKNDIEAITQKGLKDDEEWKQISVVLSDFFNKVYSDEDLMKQSEPMLEKISDAVQEYDLKKSMEQRKTVIQKIAIDNGKIEYKAKGEVYGSLLNQFSLDEYDGNLRLATTVDVWAKERVQYNSVYVLDENLKKVGELTDLAKDEQIFAARFLGDRLYLVTFQQVDPFFVIDLSDASNPKVLGKLKIPGFSDYLHPYDENHIIGIGKETGESDWGGVITKGIKIALFDVTDVSNPVEVSKIEIGDSGSDSPALHDHKAFLFSKEKNLLVLPVSEITNRDRPNPYTYSYSVWNGAYVFHLDENGFKELGKVEHSSGKRDYFNWYDDTSVMRSLYLDNNLYTISNKFIKINDLSNDLEELNTVKLPVQDYNNYPTPIPMGETVTVDVAVK
jgi:uncharacterized secreted protein with C-terminal beta-propeller domain